MTRIILIRHGETDWNVARRIQGSTDISLNERGEEQARLVAERLARVKLSAIYSSDYKRAEHTARLIHEQHPDIPLEFSEDLRERSWGFLEGLNWEEITRDFPEEVRGVMEGSIDHAPPGGENKKQIYNRAMRILARIVREYPDGNVIVVTHGGVTSIILKTALGIDLSARTPFRVENCALNILDTRDGISWTVQCLNDTAHLELN